MGQPASPPLSHLKNTACHSTAHRLVGPGLDVSTCQFLSVCGCWASVRRLPRQEGASKGARREGEVRKICKAERSRPFGPRRGWRERGRAPSDAGRGGRRLRLFKAHCARLALPRPSSTDRSRSRRRIACVNHFVSRKRIFFELSPERILLLVLTMP